MKPKGSTVIISFMYATWILYLAFQAWCKSVLNSFPPSEVTFCTAALFIAETVSLARLKLAKEGNRLPAKKQNPFLAKIGLGDVPDFEEEAQEESAKHAKKEES